jgi:hypothetical protein
MRLVGEPLVRTFRTYSAGITASIGNGGWQRTAQ